MHGMQLELAMHLHQVYQMFHRVQQFMLHQVKMQLMDKLFTFLNHDNVSWNNNNAEHAVKPNFLLWRNASS